MHYNTFILLNLYPDQVCILSNNYLRRAFVSITRQPFLTKSIRLSSSRPSDDLHKLLS